MASQGVDEETAYQVFNDGRLTTIEFVFFLADLNISHPGQPYENTYKNLSILYHRTSTPTASDSGPSISQTP